VSMERDEPVQKRKINESDRIKKKTDDEKIRSKTEGREA